MYIVAITKENKKFYLLLANLSLNKEQAFEFKTFDVEEELNINHYLQACLHLKQQVQIVCGLGAKNVFFKRYDLPLTQKGEILKALEHEKKSFSLNNQTIVIKSIDKILKKEKKAFATLFFTNENLLLKPIEKADPYFLIEGRALFAFFKNHCQSKNALFIFERESKFRVILVLNDGLAHFFELEEISSFFLDLDREIYPVLADYSEKKIDLLLISATIKEKDVEIFFHLNYKLELFILCLQNVPDTSFALEQGLFFEISHKKSIIIKKPAREKALEKILKKTGVRAFSAGLIIFFLTGLFGSFEKRILCNQIEEIASSYLDKSAKEKIKNKKKLDGKIEELKKGLKKNKNHFLNKEPVKVYPVLKNLEKFFHNEKIDISYQSIKTEMVSYPTAENPALNFKMSLLIELVSNDLFDTTSFYKMMKESKKIEDLHIEKKEGYYEIRFLYEYR